MSRRKQAKPQHLGAGQEERRGGLPLLRDDGSVQSGEREDTSGTGGSPRRDDTHVCNKCCAEFFTWAELKEHHKSCVEDCSVFIMKNGEGAHGGGESPSPVPSVVSSDSSAVDAGFDLGETPVTDNDSLDNAEEGLDEAMEVEHHPRDKYAIPSSPPPPDSTGTPLVSAAYSIPDTNVTLEILHSTRVAVAQFSQAVGSNGTAGRSASAAIPVILEHLLALQQQQVHQLQLIEQICSQVATMNKQPSRGASNPVSAPRPTAANTLASTNPILPLTGSTPSNVSDQGAGLVPEKSQSLPSETVCKRSAFRDPVCSSGNSTPSISTCSSISALMPPYSGSHASAIGSRQTLSCPSPGPLGQSSLLGSPAGLPFLPQSPPSGVIFPNPLASIAATANALDPLAALMKHRKGKQPSLFESKPAPEEPFFKHKCRFCAKVFGSDSALQIHLRSHTGERPFKCNICGNRFSTKGNLKVHFQRHKEKYPQVQMNPYPVPEYLDNVPTTSGIPYGMSVPPEKPVSSWLDTKAAMATLPASVGLPLSSTGTGVGGVAPSVPPLYQPAAAECVSPSQRGRDAHTSPLLETPLSNHEIEGSNLEMVHLPQTCPQKPRSTPATGTTIRSVATTPEPAASASPVSSSPSPLPLNSEEVSLSSSDPMDSMQTSETSKLQQLVENIDKKMTDPNQCGLCHRILSCQSALKMHYRIHTGERPYKCKVCGRAFTTKGNLKTHVGVHRENPPVQVQHSCPICQKKFTNAVVLQQHIRMHVVGQTPESAQLEMAGDMNDRSFDSPSSNDQDLGDDVSMEGDDTEEGRDVENVALLSSPKSSPAPENQMMNLSTFFGSKPLTNGYGDYAQLQIKCSLTEKGLENLGANSPPATPPLSPPQRTDSGELFVASVKKEHLESPASAPLELRGTQPNKVCVKEETMYCSAIQPRPMGLPNLTSTSSRSIKMEVNGHSDGQHPSFGVHLSAPYPSVVTSPGITSLLGAAPPRRAPKQHNCNVCGKNFSSASALQIHERTHTGEKPFVCSVCGRAFTTKGNLKVHMGTHMWNNTPARRGRRLSVDNPIALLGGDAMKLGEMFQKDLASRAMNVDAGFWSRYASAITNSLAMKNNEISVIQNGGISTLHQMTAGIDRVNGTASPMTSLAKNGMELGNGRHFSMLIDDSKEIGIN
uniref:sal-like protein 3 n=1 Tax=Doryrhamphus excisus TaxID=161450 RepID=UPI0025ADAA9B|nr:sal-like protein 3 [Doryrhamphus excisus]XP_057902528.1 sal-like protein 3 [Doryrhamphus excisus]XP_057902529.1 sal-like protein 3 [Doryrhamphus excisus]XP_057902530.1 sal-like protein 3 [Doryrhamphus excisus]XP_057902531.1 sal-like protein 3 [Doryrhamphus excisus]XP_057902532.1 sal-like protein 3 [Doryrhamphus excisus]